ncbi:MAG: TlpA family protein disulfide reductase [candidate division Zixibacteria bacterium]|nr:TlpA family protein disulfide reductase [candidate division Zixibacteria bacterium]
MNRRIKNSHLIISLFLLLILIQCGGNPHQGNPNPGFDFSLPDLDGEIHSMKDFSGRILVLNFWATWCPPCLEEVPKLNDLYDRYKNKGVQVVGIALDKDSLELVVPFVKESKIDYPILVGNTQILSNLKNFKGVPTTLLFDKKGKIQKRFDGSFDLEQLEESLQSLLME